MADFSGQEFEAESASEEDVVSKTNNLLSQFNLPTQVTSVSDITAALFVVLYESLFSDRLPDIVRQPVTKDDEISNCQTVIDVLSVDVIKDNMSHIRGVDIVEGKVQAIDNLLDVFTFLYEYVVKQTESDASGNSDTDDDVQSECLDTVVEGREVSQTDLLDRKENGYKTHSKEEERRPHRGDANGSLRSGRGTERTLDSTADLIREGEHLENQFEEEQCQTTASTVRDKWDSDEESVPLDFIGLQPVTSSSGTTTRSSDSRGNMLFTGAPFYRSLAQKEAFLESIIPMTNNAAVKNPDQADYVALCRPKQDYLDLGGPRNFLESIIPMTNTVKNPDQADYAALCCPKQDYLDLGPRNMAATEPSDYRRPRSPGRMRSTVAEVPPRRQMMPEKGFPPKGEPGVNMLPYSIEDLHQMMQQIAALTRQSIDSSLLAEKPDRPSQMNVAHLSQERCRVPLTDGMALARELNYEQLPYEDPHPLSSGEPTQTDVYGRPQKGMAAHSEKLSTMKDRGTRTAPPKKVPSSEATAYIPPNKDYMRPSTSAAARGSCRALTRSQSDRQQSPSAQVPPKSSGGARPKKRGGKTVSSDKEAERAAARLKKAAAMEDRGEERERISRSRYSAREVEERRARLSNRLQMGKPTLANTQRRLETEDQIFQQKRGFLKKLYDEDFGDAADDVRTQLSTERKHMKDKEKDFKKLTDLMRGGPRKPKPPTKPKGVLLPKTKKSKTLRLSKSPKSRSTTAKATQSRAAAMLPLLLEELPYMNLTDHAWQDLQHKGGMQIESLTRAYDEGKRRKSKVQLQLEEISEKHEKMSAILRKQMEHSQRRHQMKEEKRQQVVTANMLHERRSHSARTRRYYNEYQVQARSKMLQQRTREETLLKNLFQDGLAIQKERIQEVRRYGKEQRDKQAKKRQDEIDSMENFYKDQMEVLTEKLLQDKDVRTAREKAHQKMVEQMKRDLRNKMEKEIHGIQYQMVRDDDNVYIRQLEADRLRHKMQHAKVQARVCVA